MCCFRSHIAYFISFCTDFSFKHLVDFGKNASALAVTAMPPTNCMLYAVLDDPKGPVAARIRMEIPEDGKALVISAPIQAEGIHDLYLISDGDMKIYSWTVRE